MKHIVTELRPALLSTLLLGILCCGAYPLCVHGISQLVFPDKANGSLVTDRSGTVTGSSLLGQNFTATNYFHPRPSAAGNGYDAANSGGSNLGPTSGALAKTLRERVAEYRRENGLKDTEPVPADAVTASASGLDPHISPRNARLQAGRVAAARGIPEHRLEELIERCTAYPQFGILGEPGVNVLQLNLALDAAKDSTR